MKDSGRILMVALLSLGASGCLKVGPDYARPETAVNGRWSDVRSEEIATQSSENRDWWLQMGDPVLTDLIERARETSPDLQIAMARMEQSIAELGIATGLLWPQVQRLFGYYVAGKLSESIPPISSLPDNFKSNADTNNTLTSLSFEIAWELDLWGLYRRQIEGATGDYLASVADYEDAMVSLFGQIGEAYGALRLAQATLTLIETNIKVQRRSLEIATVRFRNGETTELDVQEARSQLLATEALVPDVEKALVHTKNALTLLVGEPPGALSSWLDPRSDLPALPSEIRVGVPGDLLRHRPDVRAAEYRAMAESARIGVSEAELYPHLALVGTVGLSATDVGKMFRPESLFWTAGPGIRWNILNYGRLKNAVRAQDAIFQQAMLGYRDAVLRAQSEVENSLSALYYAKQREDILVQAVEAAERSLQLSLTQYREGVADFDRVLSAQRSLLGQAQQRLEAQADGVLSAVRLYRALGGGGWDMSDLEESME